MHTIIPLIVVQKEVSSPYLCLPGCTLQLPLSLLPLHVLDAHHQALVLLGNLRLGEPSHQALKGLLRFHSQACLTCPLLGVLNIASRGEPKCQVPTPKS